MDAESLKKRRMRVLRDLAAKCKGRHDAKLPLSEIAPSLEITVFVGGSKFTDKGDPAYEGGSDEAYDYNTLCDDGFIKRTHLNHKSDRRGDVVYFNPGVKVTPEGFQAVAEARKSWLAKSIEKQPMTFVQVILMIVIALGGWAIGRYLTPLHGDTPATVPTDNPKEPR